MGSKVKKQPWEVVLKDRFISAEHQENPYLVVALYVFVFLLSLLLILVVFFQLCLIDGTSMSDTLSDKEHVMLIRSVSSFDYGDIVVITKKDDNGSTTNIIKRVIGLGGDTLTFKQEGNNIVVFRKSAGSDNFVALDESSYIKDGAMTKLNSNKYSLNQEIEIPDDYLFVMGDNRDNSADSRVDGPYSASSVFGKYLFKVGKDSLLEYFLKFIYHENTAPVNDN